MKNLNSDRAIILDAIWNLKKEDFNSQKNYMLDRFLRWYTDFNIEGIKAWGSFKRSLKYFKWTEDAAKIADKILNKEIPRKGWLKHFITEHNVPLKVIKDKYHTLPKSCSKQDIFNILEETEMIMVTREEDEKLTNAGFRTSGTKEERLAVLSPLDQRYINNKVI